jgi:5'-3' exonuclease
MKYLFIDGNNLSIRHAFANEELSNQAGIPSGIHYGVFSSLISLREKFPTHQMLVVWDGKSKRRMEESQEGVKEGLIKSAYKENRDKDEQPQPLLDFYEQSPFLKRGIEQAGIPQIRLHSFEADDIISSYCKYLYDEAEEMICLTSDHDYYQLLNDKVIIYDGMKDTMITEASFKEKYGITPEQHVDVGALMGDSGDNIFGISGWGEKTALKAIQEHGSWEAVIDHLKKLYDPIRQQYPDCNQADFERLRNIRTPAEEKKFQAGQEWKGKYADIQQWMPYTGVALAFEDKRWKPTKDLKTGLKNNLLALMFEERIKLAYSLKKMDTNIEDLPSIENRELNRERLIEYFDYYDIESLKESVGVFEQV